MRTQQRQTFTDLENQIRADLSGEKTLVLIEHLLASKLPELSPAALKSAVEIVRLSWEKYHKRALANQI